ncbi:endonuclease domain-containing protein [Streptomyces sp. NPDC056069]|uniref:endonuclease domain-containing protein n=1 Tax=Streptomyces sp. NPDC056069 TaxID=3345702 RepID=UPI0035E2E902
MDMMKCHICEVEYKPSQRNSKQRYCSRKCASASGNLRKRKNPSLKRCRTCLLDLEVAQFELSHTSCRGCEELAQKGQKLCRTCSHVKSAEDFHARSARPDGRDSACKACRSEKSRRRNADPAKRDARRDLKYRARYGIGVEDVETKLQSQAGRCAICADRMDKYVVDHNHVTGAVRDLLCNSCNALIGYSRERRDLLQSAIQYLERHNHDQDMGP